MPPKQIHYVSPLEKFLASVVIATVVGTAAVIATPAETREKATKAIKAFVTPAPKP